MDNCGSGKERHDRRILDVEERRDMIGEYLGWRKERHDRRILGVEKGDTWVRRWEAHDTRIPGVGERRDMIGRYLNKKTL